MQAYGCLEITKMQKQKTTLEKYQQTDLKLKESQARKGFIANLTAYIIVNSLLVTINMLTVPEFTWFMFPMCGWGFGVTMHYLFGVSLLGKQVKAEQAKIERTAAN